MGRPGRLAPRSATVQLLRALTLLAPRLHGPEAAASAEALFALVCDTLRGVGLSSHIASLDEDGVLRIVATSLDGPVVAGIEGLIGRSFIGYPLPRTGPYGKALESDRALEIEIASVEAILQPIVPQLDEEGHAELARGAQAEHAVLAPFVTGGRVNGVLTVFGPANRLALEDAPVVAALGAQIGVALENSRLLRETEAERVRWQGAVEAIAEMVVTCDATGRLTYFNAAAERVMGQFMAGLASERHAEIYHLFDADSRPFQAEELPLVRALHTGQPTGPILMRIREAEEVDRHTVWTASPLRDSAGTLLGAVAVGRDITRERVLEEQNLAALETLLRVAALVTDAGLPADPATLLTGVTEALQGLAAVDFTHGMLVDERGPELIALRLFGVEAEVEAEWRASVAAFDPAASDRVPGVLALLRQGKLLRQQFDLERPIIALGTVRSLKIRAAITAPVLVEGEVVGLLTIGRVRASEPGVTELFAPWDEELLGGVARLAGEALARARLSRRLDVAEAARWAAEEATRQRDEFLSVASHELRTPLTSVKANVQIANRRMREAASSPEAGQRTSQILARADRQVDRLIRLVDDLVDASRIQSDRLELRRRRLDLREVVREAVEEQRQLTSPARLRLELPDRPVVVDGDADRLGQVVTNYLTNALKYSPESAPVVVRVERDAAARARVSVRDEGPGVPPEEREEIWRRFYRAVGVRVQSGSGVGLGLGLYISREIMVRHGGAVGVEGAPGEGSTFWFTLPLAEEG